MDPRHRTYETYLRSAAWHQTRSRYARSRCAVCDSPRVELHHRTYVRVGRERPQDLVTLCRRHHGALHRFARARPHMTLRAATVAYLKWARPLVTAAA